MSHDFRRARSRPIAKDRQRAVTAIQIIRPEISPVFSGMKISQWVQVRGLFLVFFKKPDLIPPKHVLIQYRRVMRCKHELGIVGNGLAGMKQVNQELHQFRMQTAM
jgi:hypothetical protein